MELKSIIPVMVYNIVLVVIIGIVALNVTAWALLGLIFLASTSDTIVVKLKNGTVIKATGSEAIEAARYMQREENK